MDGLSPRRPTVPRMSVLELIAENERLKHDIRNLSIVLDQTLEQCQIDMDEIDELKYGSEKELKDKQYKSQITLLSEFVDFVGDIYRDLEHADYTLAVHLLAKARKEFTNEG